MPRDKSQSYNLFLHRGTDKALLVSEHGDNDLAVWLPKSQIEYDTHAASGDYTDIIVPDWLAEEKGLFA